MPIYRPAPSRRALYRHAKRTLYKAAVSRWTGSRASLDKHIRAFLRGKRRTYLLRLVRRHAFALAVATALLTGVSANTAPPIELSDIAMDANAGGFVMNGEGEYAQAGFSVSGAGDVNGDGLADFIVGAIRATPSPEALRAGIAYVVFGKGNGTSLDLRSVSDGSGGFAINGYGYSFTGWSVSGAGDVNGDGLDDLIVGAFRASPGYLADAGASYVVFGKADNAPVELSNLGAGGFVINGEAVGDYSGYSVSGAGDVNGDEFADLIVGAPSGTGSASNRAGKSYVVFGKADGMAVELSNVAGGMGGFVINGAAMDDFSGHSVSGAGDVNGDTLDDLVVGAGTKFNSGHGTSYVVFGKANGTAVELSNLGAGGFVINGETEGDLSGYSVSGAGDVNGDGFADLIVGAPAADNPPGDNLSGDVSGKSYVVFGKTTGTAVDLASVAAGAGGFVMNGTEFFALSGYSVSGAGDVNGDGLADLIVGAFGSYPNGYASGKSYVVFGKTDGTPVELSSVAAGVGGFVMNGEAADDFSGVSVSGAGDVNGDGLADLIVGATGADPNGLESGKSYVVFSPIAGPVQWVDFAYPGTHEGTEALPFQKLKHAANAVTPGGTINIKGNTADSDSPETFTGDQVLDQAVTINAVGGTVTIGNSAARSARNAAEGNGFISADQLPR